MGENVVEGNPVSIIDIRIPFWRLVAFFVKAALAAVPAAIIVVIIYVLVAGALVAIVGPKLF
jgi:hypothetical protein